MFEKSTEPTYVDEGCCDAAFEEAYQELGKEVKVRDSLPAKPPMIDEATARLARAAADQIQATGEIGKDAFDKIIAELTKPVLAGKKFSFNNAPCALVEAINQEFKARGLTCSLQITEQMRRWCKPYPPPANYSDVTLSLSPDKKNGIEYAAWGLLTVAYTDKRTEITRENYLPFHRR